MKKLIVVRHLDEKEICEGMQEALLPHSMEALSKILGNGSMNSIAFGGMKFVYDINPDKVIITKPFNITEADVEISKVDILFEDSSNGKELCYSLSEKKIIRFKVFWSDLTHEYIWDLPSENNRVEIIDWLSNMKSI